MTDGYDIIGDVHGHAAELEALLEKLGYRESDGAHRHPSRTAVFVGDLVDRGPDQMRVLEIVRSMVDAGTAQITLGNHEFNAIAWATPRPDGSGHCREHRVKNRRQHEAFLAQVGEDSSTHRSWIGWFRTLPLWLDLGGVRVVHACWDPLSMDVLGGPTLTDEMVTAEKGSDLYEAIEIVLKGPEVDLGGLCYLDKGGHKRTKARFRWWNPNTTTLASGAEIPSNSLACDKTPFGELPDTELPRELPRIPEGAPVLYGHYWRSGTPTVDSPKTACLDWSVAAGGPLVAYRWSGEIELANANLIS